MISFWSYVAKNQLPGNKRMIDSTLSSWIQNPEAMNPDLESIIKQTKHYIQLFFLIFISDRVWLSKEKTDP